MQEFRIKYAGIDKENNAMEKIEFSQNAAEADREKPYTAETFRKVGQEKLAHLTAIKELMVGGRV